MNTRSRVFLATPGPDRERLGYVPFRGAPFVHHALRMAYRMARRQLDPIDARIVTVTAFAGGLGGDPSSPRHQVVGLLDMPTVGELLHEGARLRLVK